MPAPACGLRSHLADSEGRLCRGAGKARASGPQDDSKLAQTVVRDSGPQETTPGHTVMFDHDHVPKCGIPGAEPRPLANY